MKLLLTWLLLSLPLYGGEFDEVRDYIRSHMAADRVPSISVAVARDGHILWEEGFGWADREKRVAANQHTMYSVASISKPFTATGLMTLVEQKRIDLDRPINQYLGKAQLRARVGNAEDATVRRVANHTSGLPFHYQFFYQDEPFRPPSMDETIRRYGNLVTMPGEKWEYSNLGYGILDYVIARVSGESYDDYMRQAVFLKLGLTHTSVGIGPGLEKFAAVRYGSDGLPLPFFDFDHRGASAIYSSAHDLVRFGMFHLGAHLPGQTQILSDSSLAEMQKFSPHTDSDERLWNRLVCEPQCERLRCRVAHRRYERSHVVPSSGSLGKTGNRRLMQCQRGSSRRGCGEAPGGSLAKLEGAAKRAAPTSHQTASHANGHVDRDSVDL